MLSKANTLLIDNSSLFFSFTDVVKLIIFIDINNLELIYFMESKNLNICQTLNVKFFLDILQNMVLFLCTQIPGKWNKLFTS